ncbi:MAG: hypothetical protein WD875_04010 [Pirellulales bacterium]
MSFDEDRRRIRTGSSPQFLAALHNAGIERASPQQEKNRRGKRTGGCGI